MYQDRARHHFGPEEFDCGHLRRDAVHVDRQISDLGRRHLRKRMGYGSSNDLYRKAFERLDDVFVAFLVSPAGPAELAFGVRNQFVDQALKSVHQIQLLIDRPKIDVVEDGARIPSSIHTAFDEVTFEVLRMPGGPTADV